MRLATWVAIFAVFIAAAAWLTRPGIGDFDALLKAEIQTKIAKTDIGQDSDALATLALVGCKLRPSDCFDIIRKNLDVQTDTHAFYTRFQVNGFRREATCTGAFTKIWCSRNLLAE